jgi:hypothetical protein
VACSTFRKVRVSRGMAHTSKPLRFFEISVLLSRMADPRQKERKNKNPDKSRRRRMEIMQLNGICKPALTLSGRLPTWRIDAMECRGLHWSEARCAKRVEGPGGECPVWRLYLYDGFFVFCVNRSFVVLLGFFGHHHKFDLMLNGPS